MAIRRLKRAGFTLLEILIAIGILALGLVTVFSLFPVGIYAVKETVDDTRSASLAATARADMAAIRANLRILDAGSQSYPGYIPFGPWRCPGDVHVFRAPLYEFVSGSPVRRVVFDDRTMVPVRMWGTFDGTAVVTVRQVDLNRDSDRLEYFYSGGAGANQFDPYEILLRVRGRCYQIYDSTYTLIGSPVPLARPNHLPNGYLATLTLATAPPPIPGQVQFEILLPVALKEPPLDVPVEWTGGVADFSVAGPTYDLDTTNFHNRNLALYLAAPDGWISLPSLRGDWFQVTVINWGAVPPTVTLDNAQPLPGGTSADEFLIALPVVEIDPINVSGDFLVLPVIAGGGPQFACLESGAFIEVLFDGAMGTFATTGGNTVNIVGSPNTDFSSIVAPGNFIRVQNRDYEIADDSGMDASFDIVGAVPNLGDAYFNIVLGYDVAVAGQVPRVARFPVTGVQRRTTTGNPVYEFSVGRDANGNLPTDLFPGGFSFPKRTPVRVMPRAFTQFSYEVVFNPKSPVGDFTALSSQVNAPSWLVGPVTPAIGPIEFPITLDPTAATPPSGALPYSAQALTSADLAGNNFTGTITSVDPSYTFLNVSNLPNFTARLPFHAFDQGDFVADLQAGVGQFVVIAGPPITYQVNFTAGTSPQITSDAIYLAPGVLVDLRDSVGLVLASGTVQAVNNQLVTIDLGGPGIPGGPPPLVGGEDVYVWITASIGVGLTQTAKGRGDFYQGSDTVVAVYTDALPLTGGGNWRGFPFSTASPARHELSLGDYILAPDGRSYAVKAINDTTTGAPASRKDFLVLDRPFEGATIPDVFFRYVTPIEEVYGAQVAVFRNYRITALKDAAGARAQAAAFGYDAVGALDPLEVQLRVPLPPNFKPGDFIRADGDADHSSASPTDLGLFDAVDGDWYWYMIDRISANRQTITLTSPYRGYVPSTMVYQPASATNGIVRTFDTAVGAF